MIEFIPENPKSVKVVRDGHTIGRITKTRVTGDESKTIWSGIVDHLVIKAEELCVAKRQVHDFVDDKVSVDLTAAGRKALAAYGPMRQAKVMVAAARGVNALDNIAIHFKRARALADEGQTEMAVAQLVPLKDSLLLVIDALNFAGVSGRTEKV